MDLMPEDLKKSVVSFLYLSSYGFVPDDIGIDSTLKTINSEVDWNKIYNGDLQEHDRARSLISGQAALYSAGTRLSNLVSNRYAFSYDELMKGMDDEYSPAYYLAINLLKTAYEKHPDVVGRFFREASSLKYENNRVNSAWLDRGLSNLFRYILANEENEGDNSVYEAVED